MLLFLESIGTGELLFILVAALVLFGPRKLPELARSLGKSLNEFKRASEDFKQTWQREVELERFENDRQQTDAQLLTATATPENFAGAAAIEATANDEAAAENNIANSATTLAPPLVTEMDAKAFESASELTVRAPVGESFARGSLSDAGEASSVAVAQTNGDGARAEANETQSPIFEDERLINHNERTARPVSSSSSTRKRDWL